MRKPARIHVTGASGSGSTTLGAALADALKVPHLEADAYMWAPSDPPFTRMRAIDERVPLLRADLRRSYNWVLSGGSMYAWGPWMKTLFSLVVFLDTPVDVRLERLRRRERETHGDAVLPGGRMHARMNRLINWAKVYDDRGVNPRIRSRERQETWLATLSCPVLRLSGELATPAQVAAVRRALG